MKADDERWWCNVWAPPIKLHHRQASSRWTPHGHIVPLDAALSAPRPIAAASQFFRVIVDPDAPVPFFFSSHFFPPLFLVLLLVILSVFFFN